MITTYGDAGTIWIFFFGLYCSDHRGVGDIFVSIMEDVFVIDDKELISTFNALATCIFSFSYTLAEASHFAAEGMVPDFGVFGVVA